MNGWILAGSGVTLAWCGLPFVARAAWPRGPSEPASTHTRLVLALLLATMLFLVPALRSWLPVPAHAPLHLAIQLLASTDAGPMLRAAPRGMMFVSPFTLIAVAWSVAVGVAVLRLVAAAIRLRRLLGATHAPSPRLVELLASEAKELGVRVPRLRVSNDARAPFVTGIFRPLIVLPEGLVTTLDASEIALVLRHELMHLRRGDLAIAAVVAACAALFAGHPTARRLVREIRLAREAAVDAAVALPDMHAYARLLVEVASLTECGERLAHVSMDDTALARRIAMLTQRQSNEPKVRFRAVILATTTIAGLGLAAPAVLADPPSKVFFATRIGEGIVPHHDEIHACFEAARKENANLVIDTTARFELDRNGKVISASVPTPESPTFQKCVESQAMNWNFPTPPAPPNAPPPPDAKAVIMLRLVLPRT